MKKKCLPILFLHSSKEERMNRDEWITIHGCLVDDLWTIVVQYGSLVERVMLANTIPFLSAHYPTSIKHFDLHKLIRDGHLNVLQWMSSLPAPNMFSEPRTAFTAWGYLPWPYTHAARPEQQKTISTLSIHNGTVAMHYTESLWTLPTVSLPQCPRPTAFTTVTSLQPIAKEVVDAAKIQFSSTIFADPSPADNLQWSLLATAAFCDRAEIFRWLYTSLVLPTDNGEIYHIIKVASIAVLDVLYQLYPKNIQSVDVRLCCEWRRYEAMVIESWFAAAGNRTWSTPSGHFPVPRAAVLQDGDDEDDEERTYEEQLDSERWNEYYCGR